MNPLLQAALEAVWHVPCGGAIYGDDNLVFIANDWHTALLPVYLQVNDLDALKACVAARAELMSRENTHLLCFENGSHLASSQQSLHLGRPLCAVEAVGNVTYVTL